MLMAMATIPATLVGILMCSSYVDDVHSTGCGDVRELAD